MTSKAAAKALAAAVLHASGLLGLHRHMALRERAVVLMYHRVLREDEVPASIDPGMYVLSSAFERHLKYLAQTFTLVGLEEILAWMEGRVAFARPPCAITFDDGWSDNYRNAWPLLRRFGAPATIFLITGQIGAPQMLTWDHVREMEADGVRFGSHTETHPLLTSIAADRIERELAESWRQLQGHVTKPSRWFCYPKGHHDQSTRAIASRYYAAAVTTERAAVSKRMDRFQIPRIGVHNDIASTTAMFAWRLSTARCIR
jgi:peptidoglycan/xylan/chitin deacetylase (PgdA/CDA1 family)